MVIHKHYIVMCLLSTSIASQERLTACECVHCHDHVYRQSRHLQFHRRRSRKVQELWWQGLPPGVRGEVWRRAIGNELNISPGGRLAAAWNGPFSAMMSCGEK